MAQGIQKNSASLGLIVSILVLASSVSIMSTDMYAPSLPDLTDIFDTTATKVKLTISLNLLAFGLAQLIHGPLSDRFGRRPVLLWSLVAVVVGCVLCVLAQTINQLIVARIFLGTVAAAEAVVGLAIIKDLYTEKQQVKAFAFLGMVIAIVPAIAPIIGGYLHVGFGWKSNFLAIAGMAVLAAGVIYQYLPESTVPDKHALQLKRIANEYGRLLHNAEFVSHTLLLGVALGLIFVFVTAAPFVLITYLSVSVEHFGYYQATMVLSFFMGSLLASRLADHWPAERLLQAGCMLALLGSVLLIALIFAKQLTPISLIATYSIMTFGMGPLFAVAPSRALRSVHTKAGSASAMLSGLEQCTAAISGIAVSLLHDGTARPMALVTLILAASLIGLLYWIKLQSRSLA